MEKITEDDFELIKSIKNKRTPLVEFFEKYLSGKEVDYHIYNKLALQEIEANRFLAVCDIKFPYKWQIGAMVMYVVGNSFEEDLKKGVGGKMIRKYRWATERIRNSSVKDNTDLQGVDDWKKEFGEELHSL